MAPPPQDSASMPTLLTGGFLGQQPANDRSSRSLLSPIEYDADAVSIRSDQDSDSDDDELQLRARTSGELRAHDHLVFEDEDETDLLVTSALREQDRGRRGSGLANPLRLLGLKKDNSRSRSRTRATDGLLGSGSSNESLRKTNRVGSGAHSERRKARRQRRKDKKNRLLQQARNGEDGELMFELEEGGIKEGSSTGDSSEHDDSFELDRSSLQQHQTAAQERRKRRKWARRLLHALVAVAFAILVLGAWKMTLDKKRAAKQLQPQAVKEYPADQLVSNGTALFAPTTLIISLDGFRADFLARGLTPRLSSFVREGVSPAYMLPSFPSVTFPNHYTLATGLYPESHGIVSNTFWDPALQAEFFYTDPARSLDPKWWGGEPFWVTAERAGVRTAVHMWPGSEAHIQHMEPSVVDKFNGDEPLPKKVTRILGFLDKPGREHPHHEQMLARDQRPQVIAAYVPNVDADGHRYGPNSTEIRGTIAAVDQLLDDIFQGLADRNLTHIVNVIVVSDHGMATTDASRLLQLEDLVPGGDMGQIAHVDGWPLVGLRPAAGVALDTLYQGVLATTRDNPNVEVYLRDRNMPARYHFANNDRIAPLWLVPKAGWNIVQRDEFDVAEGLAHNLVYHPRGLHGYDHEHPLMRAIFIARGPAFPHAPNSKLDVFQNIEVYNMLCDSVGLEPKANNGTLRLPLRPVGLHDSEAPMEEPADPVPPYTVTSSSPLVAQATESVGVDTVSTQPAAAATTPVATTTAVAAPAATDLPPATGDKQDGDNDDNGKKKNPVQEVWDWLADRFGKAWNKITGGGKKEDGEKDEQSGN